MAKTHYIPIIVEIYETDQTSGKHGKRHIRPAPGQPFPQTLDIECDSTLTERYPVRTLLKMKVIKKYRNGKGEHLYSYWGWEPDLVWHPDHDS